jgi:hypothetical protein
MVDIVDCFHYLIGFLIVSFLLWIIIKTHTYFSKDNLPLDSMFETTNTNTK